MPKYTVRVELNDDPKAIINLDHIMRQSGFSKYIESKTGDVYSLPTGEYNFDGELNSADLLEKTKAVASTISDDFSVLITLSEVRKWYNLKMHRVPKIR